ncbi:MAG TPA: hypothetical protein VFZ26_09910 [Gemmatimonadales bacterium]
MYRRAFALPLLCLGGLAVASCRSDKPMADAAREAPADPVTVTVTTSDFAFEAPAEIPAGLATWRLVNRGPSLHHVQLFKLAEGKTMDDWFAALKAGGPPPQWATPAGGPNPAELGDTTTTVMALEPGSYAMICFIPSADGVPHVMKGMARPLTVTPATGAAAAAPQADVVMKLVDYDFELSAPLTAGRHTIKVENAGPQPHEVAIVRLVEGKEPMEFAEWGERPVGPSPATIHGGVSAIMPGAEAFLEVDLEPGDYGLICFVPDMKDGKGHYHHGMIKRITVS